LVQVRPASELSQVIDLSTHFWPYFSVTAPGSMIVSPAQIRSALPEAGNQKNLP
jgi:hypothetical protein